MRDAKASPDPKHSVDEERDVAAIYAKLNAYLSDLRTNHFDKLALWLEASLTKDGDGRALREDSSQAADDILDAAAAYLNCLELWGYGYHRQRNGSFDVRRSQEIQSDDADANLRRRNSISSELSKLRRSNVLAHTKPGTRTIISLCSGSQQLRIKIHVGQSFPIGHSAIAVTARGFRGVRKDKDSAWSGSQPSTKKGYLGKGSPR